MQLTSLSKSLLVILSHDNYILCIGEPYMIAHHSLAYSFQNTDIDDKQMVNFMCDIQFMWVIEPLQSKYALDM